MRIKGFKCVGVEVQRNAIAKDIVILDVEVLERFKSENNVKTFARNTFQKGLADLVKNKIIARHTRQGWYYINPNFIFNGDRIAFTTLIERKKRNARHQNARYV